MDESGVSRWEFRRYQHEGLKLGGRHDHDSHELGTTAAND
jgi:hypothetical protein